ncbi:unnamed protein product [Linum trigynum]|uniref:Uncharacterized protein n=1 Tax=Linum trigynum TaxID=586398 RepID=A0AAV2CXK5_9ROSI
MHITVAMEHYAIMAHINKLRKDGVDHQPVKVIPDQLDLEATLSHKQEEIAQQLKSLQPELASLTQEHKSSKRQLDVSCYAIKDHPIHEKIQRMKSIPKRP